jgi:hypothetical protein
MIVKNHALVSVPSVCTISKFSTFESMYMYYSTRGCTCTPTDEPARRRGALNPCLNLPLKVVATRITDSNLYSINPSQFAQLSSEWCMVPKYSSTAVLEYPCMLPEHGPGLHKTMYVACYEHGFMKTRPEVSLEQLVQVWNGLAELVPGLNLSKRAAQRREPFTAQGRVPLAEPQGIPRRRAAGARAAGLRAGAPT